MWEQLTQAIYKKNITEAQSLINQLGRAELSRKDSNGNTLLLLAAAHRLEKICKLLIYKMTRQAINEVNDTGETALIRAAANGLEETCKLLISKMSKKAINIKDKDNLTALDWANKHGLKKINELITIKISNQPIDSSNYNTSKYELLINAIHSKNIHKAQNLIVQMNKHELSKIPTDGHTALIWATYYNCKGKFNTICELLISKMSDTAINSIPTKPLTTALFWATFYGSEKLSELLASRADERVINIITENGYTALSQACFSRFEIVCEQLIPKMTEQALIVVDNNGNTALTMAACKSMDKICNLIVSRMSQSNIYEILIKATYQTPLEAITLIQYLNSNELNKFDNNGNTILIQAILKGYFSICELLISKMSDQAINQINNKGETALSLAQQKGFKNVFNLLALKIDEQNNGINKINVEKKQEEEQQSLKLKQITLVTNENKSTDIKDLVQENIKEELVIFQKIVIEIIDKLQSNEAVSEKDKDIMQNSINEIARTVKTFINKADVTIMIKSMEKLISDKITKTRIAVLEEDLNEIIEQQIKLEEHIRTEKLAIFDKIIAEIITKLEVTTINLQDKNIMQNSIKDITNKVQKLADKTNIETITENMKELVSGKLTKARLGVVEEDIDQLIEQQQNKLNHNILVNKVVEIVYDKPILNHLKLLSTAINSKLNANLIQEAINTNDEELILAGLISVGYDVTLIN